VREFAFERHWPLPGDVFRYWATSVRTAALLRMLVMTQTKTKKMLCAVKLGECGARKGEFIIPSFGDEASNRFIGIDSRDYVEFGCIVYTGKDLTAETLLSRYTASGVQITEPQEALDNFDAYLAHIKRFKVGNVLRLEQVGDRFDLILSHTRPPDGTF
jgi:hypothetical protein